MISFERSERTITKFAAGLALVGGSGLLFATAFTCLSIILRLCRRLADWIFGTTTVGEALPWLHSILGEEELVTYGVGFALFAALPWVMIKKGHITIDLFEPVFSRRFNKVLDLIGDLSLMALAYLIMTRQWFLIFKKPRGVYDPLASLILQGDFTEVAERVRTSQESQILGVPLWPTYIIAEICIISFFVVACFCVWRSARILFNLRQIGV